MTVCLVLAWVGACHALHFEPAPRLPSDAAQFASPATARQHLSRLRSRREWEAAQTFLWQAVHEHPTTGEPLWFNGVHTNHRSYYEEAEHIDTSDGSPMHTAFADGADIPEAMIASIRGVVWNHSVALRCQTGDVVVVDNMLAAHGRMGWVSGHPRKVLLTHFK